MALRFMSPRHSCRTTPRLCCVGVSRGSWILTGTSQCSTGKPCLLASWSLPTILPAIGLSTKTLISVAQSTSSTSGAGTASVARTSDSIASRAQNPRCQDHTTDRRRPPTAPLSRRSRKSYCSSSALRLISQSSLLEAAHSPATTNSILIQRGN